MTRLPKIAFSLLMTTGTHLDGIHSRALPAEVRSIIRMRSIILSLLLVACCSQGVEPSQPITFRYIKTGEFNNTGYISTGTIFWATNHTTNTLSITLGGIENKVGSNWVVQSYEWQPLLFAPPGTTGGQRYLAAHSAGYATVQLSSQPTGTVWRAKATVSSPLTGLSAQSKHLRLYPQILKDRLQSGNTNIPLNPFATNITFFGKFSHVLSQEVSEQPQELTLDWVQLLKIDPAGSTNDSRPSPGISGQ